MDGWEMCCRWEFGYDYCVIKLGGVVLFVGVDISMKYFMGNSFLVVLIDFSYIFGVEMLKEEDWIGLIF